MCSSDRLCNRVAHEYAKQLSPEDRVEEWHVTSPATKKTVIGLPNHRTEGCQVMCMNFTVTRGTGRSRGSWSCSYRLQVVLSIFLIIVHDHELFCTCCFVFSRYVAATVQFCRSCVPDCSVWSRRQVSGMALIRGLSGTWSRAGLSFQYQIRYSLAI
jgi:hypothetical protein